MSYDPTHLLDPEMIANQNLAYILPDLLTAELPSQGVSGNNTFTNNNNGNIFDQQVSNSLPQTSKSKFFFYKNKIQRNAMKREEGKKKKGKEKLV